MKRRIIIPCLFFTVALCGCTTQTVEDAKQIEESKTYVSKYEYETDTDGKTETQAYSEEKPTFTDWETVTGITDPAVDYKEEKVKYKSMNEEFSMGAYEYSVTAAVITKDLNYAYEIMNKDSADLILGKELKSYTTGRVRGEREDFLWIKVHVKYDGDKDFKTSMQTFLIKRDDGHLW